jgi:hypothetical protein
VRDEQAFDLGRGDLQAFVLDELLFRELVIDRMAAERGLCALSRSTM